MRSIEEFRRLNRSLEIRRNDLQSTAADVTVCTTRIKINNAGEAYADFMFPCRYAQLPSINFGFELQSTPATGKMPVFAGSVDEWYASERLPSSRLYKGARLLISSESTETISFIVVATATGIAFSGPMERD